MLTPTPSPGITVEETLACWPERAAVFVRHGLGCLGRTMAPVDRLSSTARVHDLPPARVLGASGRALRRPAAAL